ncbi:endonuclease V [Candidatus Uabimicrobium sp. HlEnr_7]|uniref:endonuclease V n=1 Tax=Candidatus Uabimicrobium helgolandensis TaxID=3095367 RepID=UPI0035570EC5
MDIARKLFIPENKKEVFVAQEKYALEVIRDNHADKISTIAGVDVSYGDKGNSAYAAVVVIDTDSQKIVEEATWTGPCEFHYEPGLLALREIPCVLRAFERLKIIPDIVVIDGNGILHPRSFGLACHAGLSLDIPTIGCAKSLLMGKHKPLKKQGDSAEIRHMGESLGVALQSQKGEDPIYVSIGHKIDIPTALSLVKKITSSTREPLPIHHAHNICKEMYYNDKKHQDDEKQQNKQKIIAMIKELRQQGLSYSKVASELNKNSEVKKLTPRKLTPRKMRNWIESNPD